MRLAAGVPSGGRIAASWSVANNAMEAPTGPDGVRPCECTADGITRLDSTATTNHKWLPRCMGAIIPKGGGGHQRRKDRMTVMWNGSIFAMLDSVFVESRR